MEHRSETQETAEAEEEDGHEVKDPDYNFKSKERFGSVRKAKGRQSGDRKKYISLPHPDPDHSMMGEMRRQLCLPTSFRGVRAFEDPQFFSYHKPAFKDICVKIALPHNRQVRPLEDETRYLNALTGVSRRAIEELRRRWWAASGGRGVNDFTAFYRLMKNCGVKDKELLYSIFDFLDVAGKGKVAFTHFVRACGVFLVGEKGLHPDELLKWDAQRNCWVGGAPPKPVPGDFTRHRALSRAQLRIELTRFFYDPQSTEDKRCANVQVNKMMKLLLEHLDLTLTLTLTLIQVNKMMKLLLEHLEPPSFEGNQAEAEEEQEEEEEEKDEDLAWDPDDVCVESSAMSRPIKNSGTQVSLLNKALSGEKKTTMLLNTEKGKKAVREIQDGLHSLKSTQ